MNKHIDIILNTMEREMRIKYRNIVRNDNNVIISGSATLVKNSYKPNSNGNRKKCGVNGGSWKSSGLDEILG